MHCTAGFFVSLWLVASIALTAKNQYYLSMKIIDLLQSGRPTLSFEVFPPKTDAAYEPLLENVQDIAALHPDFMSVTYGAGGGTSAYTVAIADDIQTGFQVPALATEGLCLVITPPLSCSGLLHRQLQGKNHNPN